MNGVFYDNRIYATLARAFLKIHPLTGIKKPEAMFFRGHRRAARNERSPVKVSAGRRGGRAIQSQELPIIPWPGRAAKIKSPFSSRHQPPTRQFGQKPRIQLFFSTSQAILQERLHSRVKNVAIIYIEPIARLGNTNALVTFEQNTCANIRRHSYGHTISAYPKITQSQ